MNDDDAGPMHDPDANRGVGPLSQPLGVDERPSAELVEVEVRVA